MDASSLRGGSKPFMALMVLLGGAAAIVIVVGFAVTFLVENEATVAHDLKTVKLRNKPPTALDREVVAGNATDLETNVTRRRLSREECLDLRDTYGVRPGRSWGGLDEDGRARWLVLACDQYLCEPHGQRGRGVYDCTPLRQGPAANQ
mmetsp:Transcript_1636/g.4170  ORF Transcript_1636/g.4170 Transcript_1636/m.4170 type:complete len:148 (-) Transcript_1636:1146-1589(-)